MLVFWLPPIDAEICTYEVPAFIIGRYEEKIFIYSRRYGEHIVFLLKQYHMIAFIIHQKNQKKMSLDKRNVFVDIKKRDFIPIDNSYYWQFLS